MRSGIHVAALHPHEASHLEPLRRRLPGGNLVPASNANVVVQADTRPPVRQAWNVQVFHGLGDKGYTGNPIFLQERRFPRVRTAFNMVSRALHLPFDFLAPPRRPGRRRSRYDQVNAYGPRWQDHFEAILDDVYISQHGHPALNDLAPRIKHDPDGPLLWLPTWDNRRYMGGPNQSSLESFAHEVALTSRNVPVQVKVHPLTLAHGQDRAACTELEKAPGVEVLPAGGSPYDLLSGVRGVLTDTSSLGFEAYCLGLPVALAVPHGVKHTGLHQELAERTTVLHSGKPDLLGWAEAPACGRDRAWARDLLAAPDPRRNDAFAQELLDRAA